MFFKKKEKEVKEEIVEQKEIEEYGCPQFLKTARTAAEMIENTSIKSFEPYRSELPSGDKLVEVISKAIEKRIANLTRRVHDDDWKYRYTALSIMLNRKIIDNRPCISFSLQGKLGMKYRDGKWDDVDDWFEFGLFDPLEEKQKTDDIRSVIVDQIFSLVDKQYTQMEIDLEYKRGYKVNITDYITKRPFDQILRANLADVVFNHKCVTPLTIGELNIEYKGIVDHTALYTPIHQFNTSALIKSINSPASVSFIVHFCHKVVITRHIEMERLSLFTYSTKQKLNNFWKRFTDYMTEK